MNRKEENWREKKRRDVERSEDILYKSREETCREVKIYYIIRYIYYINL